MNELITSAYTEQHTLQLLSLQLRRWTGHKLGDFWHCPFILGHSLYKFVAAELLRLTLARPPPNFVDFSKSHCVGRAGERGSGCRNSRGRTIKWCGRSEESGRPIWRKVVSLKKKKNGVARVSEPRGERAPTIWFPLRCTRFHRELKLSSVFPPRPDDHALLLAGTARFLKIFCPTQQARVPSHRWSVWMK